jgi:hypothetical protein
MPTPLMTKTTMASQWELDNFKPFNVSKILGYPQQIPARYENYLPRFIGGDVDSVEEHIHTNFWDFFQLHPISDEAEDMAMKLFPVTLHDDS